MAQVPPPRARPAQGPLREETYTQDSIVKVRPRRRRTADAVPNGDHSSRVRIPIIPNVRGNVNHLFRLVPFSPCTAAGLQIVNPPSRHPHRKSPSPSFPSQIPLAVTPVVNPPCRHSRRKSPYRHSRRKSPYRHSRRKPPYRHSREGGNLAVHARRAQGLIYLARRNGTCRRMPAAPPSKKHFPTSAVPIHEPNRTNPNRPLPAQPPRP